MGTRVRVDSCCRNYVRSGLIKYRQAALTGANDDISFINRPSLIIIFELLFLYSFTRQHIDKYGEIVLCILFRGYCRKHQ